MNITLHIVVIAYWATTLMLKNMKVGAKIAAGFAIVTILAIIVGIAGYVIIDDITQQVEVAETAYIIKGSCLETRRQEKKLYYPQG